MMAVVVMVEERFVSMFGWLATHCFCAFRSLLYGEPSNAAPFNRDRETSLISISQHNNSNSKQISVHGLHQPMKSRRLHLGPRLRAAELLPRLP